jgi:hypothetical protein
LQLPSLPFPKLPNPLLPLPTFADPKRHAGNRLGVGGPGWLASTVTRSVGSGQAPVNALLFTSPL